MGARAQVLIKETGVYLYSHWGSGTIEEDVSRVLKTKIARNRRKDPEYLARIIFDYLKEPYQSKERELGFGIGTKQNDIDKLVTVFPDKIVVNDYITGHEREVKI